MQSFLSIAVLALFLFSSPAFAWHRLPPGVHGFREAGWTGVRGITVGPIESSQQPDRGYGTNESAELLDELSRLGVTWISITPYGRVWSVKGDHILMDFEAAYEANRAAVRRMIEQAHERGMRVLVIPHLWVDTGGWRGVLEPLTDEAWRRYQASYRKFVLAWAHDAALAGAEALSIGVECTSWSGRFGEFWQTFIQEVRKVFPGLLTYSANWDEAPYVLFWDQLDLIGINAFYPLAKRHGASDAEYRAGAQEAMRSVRELSRILEMPVWFTEVGYTTRKDAAVEPWLWPDDMTHVVIDEHEQARAFAAVFDAFLPESWFAGFFVWRYYASIDDVSQEAIWGFSPHAKEAEPLLDEVFHSAWGVDPAGPWGAGVMSLKSESMSAH